MVLIADLLLPPMNRVDHGGEKVREHSRIHGERTIKKVGGERERERRVRIRDDAEVYNYHYADCVEILL